MTKNVTRIATMLLVEDGKLALDQAATEVLPEFSNLRVAIDVEKGLDVPAGHADDDHAASRHQHFRPRQLDTRFGQPVRSCTSSIASTASRRATSVRDLKRPGYGPQRRRSKNGGPRRGTAAGL